MLSGIDFKDCYIRSIAALKEYIERENKTITEVEWNRIAVKMNYLSSETIGYISQIGFNKLCKKILKKK